MVTWFISSPQHAYINIPKHGHSVPGKKKNAIAFFRKDKQHLCAIYNIEVNACEMCSTPHARILLEFHTRMQ